MNILKTLLTTLFAVTCVAGIAVAQNHKPLDHQPIWSEHDNYSPTRILPKGHSQSLLNTTTTTNWSGFVLNNGAYSQVSGRWQVPGAQWGQTNSNPYNLEYNTIWIGIGGFNDGTLIQMGTETTVNPSNQVTQYLWYELYPAGSVAINEPISTGDIIEADIHCTANCTPGTTQTWQMTIKNDTKGWTWSQSFPFASSMVSAEWVVESPYYNGFLPLNNFVQANWDSAMANNASTNLTTDNGLALNDAAGQTSNPSPPVNGNAFSMCYGFGGFTPCAAGSIGGTPPPPPPPPPPLAVVTAALTANPTKISTGQFVNLFWSSSNAASCTGTGFNTGGAVSGSVTLAPSISTNYGLSCTGATGTATASASVQVTAGTCTGNGKHCK